jgi:DNA-binding NarL/FixJ family response regulator
VTGQVRVLLADDDETFRITTARLLRREGYQCDCAEDAQEAMKLMKHRYDILLVDIRMSGNVNLELVRTVRRLMPKLPIIVITGYPSVDTAVRSFRLASVDYLVKPVEWGDLSRALKTALKRHKRRTPQGNEESAQRLRTPSIEGLSFQERRVIFLVSQGKTNKEISANLGLSEKTVKNYLNRVYSKLQISRRTQAAALFAGMRLSDS